MSGYDYIQLYWQRMNKHLAIPCLLIACFLILLLTNKTMSASNQFPIAVHHLYGDSNLLSDIEIVGTMQDSYHSDAFVWHRDQIDVVTTTFTQIQPRTIFAERTEQSFVARSIVNHHTYNVRGTPLGREFTIEWMRGDRAVPVEATIRIPLEPLLTTTTFANPLDYGVASIDEQVYYIVPTSQQFSGLTGIYPLQPKTSPVPFERPTDNFDTPIVELSLQANADTAEASIAILGLETVGDQLLLLAHRSQELILLRYSSTGQLIDEAVVPQFAIKNNDNAAIDGYTAAYERYANEELAQLILSFYNELSDEKIFVTVQYDKQLSIADVTKLQLKQENIFEVPLQTTNEQLITIIPAIRHALYYNDRLYYATVVYSEGNESSSLYYTIPVHLQLYIYDHNELTYSGSVWTDMNRDLIGLQQRLLKQPRTSYNDRFIRHYSNIRIQVK